MLHFWNSTDWIRRKKWQSNLSLNVYFFFPSQIKRATPEASQSRMSLLRLCSSLVYNKIRHHLVQHRLGSGFDLDPFHEVVLLVWQVGIRQLWIIYGSSGIYNGVLFKCCIGNKITSRRSVVLFSCRKHVAAEVVNHVAFHLRGETAVWQKIEERKKKTWCRCSQKVWANNFSIATLINGITCSMSPPRVLCFMHVTVYSISEIWRCF